MPLAPAVSCAMIPNFEILSQARNYRQGARKHNFLLSKPGVTVGCRPQRLGHLGYFRALAACERLHTGCSCSLSGNRVAQLLAAAT